MLDHYRPNFTILDLFEAIWIIWTNLSQFWSSSSIDCNFYTLKKKLSGYIYIYIHFFGVNFFGLCLFVLVLFVCVHGRNLISNQKKSNFKLETNPISHWNTSNFAFKEIPFHNGTNPISHLKKFHFTLEQIQLHIGTNPIWHWNKSNFTLEQILFHIGTNLISQWNKSSFKCKQIKFHIFIFHCSAEAEVCTQKFPNGRLCSKEKSWPRLQFDICVSFMSWRKLE